MEKVYSIKFSDYKECYDLIKAIYSEKTTKKVENSLFSNLKEKCLNRVETIKTIDTRIINGNGNVTNNTSNREEKLKFNDLSQNKSISETHQLKTASKEKVTYIKKVIKEKISKFDYSDTKVHLKLHQQEEKNHQLYRMRRPLNINLSNNKHDFLTSSKDPPKKEKEESNSKNRNLREIKKSSLNNYTQIHRKINVSELVSKGNMATNIHNTSNYNNSFLQNNFHHTKIDFSQQKQHPKSREASTSVNKQNSFDYNYKEKSRSKGRKLEFSASKFAKINNSGHKDDRSFNKSNVVEIIETATHTTNNTNNNVANQGQIQRRGSINLGGISILKRLSHKKNLNLDLKNINKVELNYKKLSNMNISLSGLHD